MTLRVSDDWETPAGPWLVALALSCMVHGAAVWEGRTLLWSPPREPLVAPIELVTPSPEPLHADPPSAPTPRLRPETSHRLLPVPAQPRPLPAQPQAQTRPEPQLAEPAREVPTPSLAASPSAKPRIDAPVGLPAPAPDVAPDAARGVAPGVAPGVEGSPSARARAERTGRTAGPVAAAAPTPSAPRITQSARPRGGYQVRPAYPPAARRAGVQGTTVLRAHIRADGAVDDIQVSRSAGHPALDEAAAAAVRRWRFDPARSASEAVAVWVLIPVEFRLESGE